MTPFDLVCREQPELRFPASCDNWRCMVCGPRNARKRTRVLSWARPERFVTLTQAPDNWQSLRQKVRTLTMNLRRDGYECQWAWTVETGAKTGMRHVHLLQHGSYIPQRDLQDMWGSIVHISQVKQVSDAARYAMKEAMRVCGYSMKNTQAQLATHLDNNGGRAVHMSRGFLHGLRVRDVENLLWPAQEGLTWVLEARHDTIQGPGCRVVAKMAGLPHPHRNA